MTIAQSVAERFRADFSLEPDEVLSITPGSHR